MHGEWTINQQPFSTLSYNNKAMTQVIQSSQDRLDATLDYVRHDDNFI